jgi:DNA-binding NarL/FixJ family response regulator
MRKIDGARALIVEDERSWQQILSEILTDAGMVVDVADTLETALAVVDLSLDGDDPNNQEGLHILEALGHHDPGCLKLLLTGFATVELAVSVLTDYGVFTCLRKETFNRNQFRDLIERAMNSQVNKTSIENSSTIGEKKVSSEENLIGATATALVVEDDAGWRGILFELLVDVGYQVRLCSSFGEALGHLRREEFQIAVVDLSLTGGITNQRDLKKSTSAQYLEGYRLLASTRAKAIPTIVVSGVTNPSDIEKTYHEQGIFSFMEKHSFDRRRFLTTVQEAQATVRVPRKPDILTDREREVLDLLAQGMTNKEIAETLFISTNTVKRHLKAIFKKLDIHSRSAATAKALGANTGFNDIE